MNLPLANPIATQFYPDQVESSQARITGLQVDPQHDRPGALERLDHLDPAVGFEPVESARSGTASSKTVEALTETVDEQYVIGH